MQSITRKFERINKGLQNPNPNSSKIAKSTNASKEGSCFRKGRFN